MAGPPVAAPAGAVAGARKPLPSFAAATSRAMTRPCGPEPAMRPRSMPASLARRRASGEEKTRLAPDGFVSWPLVRTPSPAACGGDLSPLGRGEGGALGAFV